MNICGLLAYSWLILSSPQKHNYVFIQWYCHRKFPPINLFENNMFLFYGFFLGVKFSRESWGSLVFFSFSRVTWDITAHNSPLDSNCYTSFTTATLNYARALIRDLIGFFSGTISVANSVPLNSIWRYYLPKSTALIAIIGGIGPEFKERIIPGQILIKMGSLNLSWKD